MGWEVGGGNGRRVGSWNWDWYKIKKKMACFLLKIKKYKNKREKEKNNAIKTFQHKLLTLLKFLEIV